MKLLVQYSTALDDAIILDATKLLYVEKRKTRHLQMNIAWGCGHFLGPFLGVSKTMSVLQRTQSSQ